MTTLTETTLFANDYGYSHAGIEQHFDAFKWCKDQFGEPSVGGRWHTAGYWFSFSEPADKTWFELRWQTQ